MMGGTPTVPVTRETMQYQPTITLLTDFGAAGIYTGVLHGVIRTLCPNAAIIDLTHQVTPQTIREGAFLLHAAYRYCPPGSIHVAVVDPGVGTARQAVALRIPDVGYCLGPDNGIFTPLLTAHPGIETRTITNPAFTLAGRGATISDTFHGRDIFAPAAATLAGGANFTAIGPSLDPITLVRLPRFWATRNESHPEQISGEVVHIDHFGNLLTNIPRALFAALAPEQLAAVTVQGGGYRCQGIGATYGRAPAGSVIALFGSSGVLEVARVNGRADRHDGTAVPLGTAIAVRLPA